MAGHQPGQTFYSGCWCCWWCCCCFRCCFCCRPCYSLLWEQQQTQQQELLSFLYLDDTGWFSLRRRKHGKSPCGPDGPPIRPQQPGEHPCSCPFGLPRPGSQEHWVYLWASFRVCRSNYRTRNHATSTLTVQPVRLVSCYRIQPRPQLLLLCCCGGGPNENSLLS